MPRTITVIQGTDPYNWDTFRISISKTRTSPADFERYCTSCAAEVEAHIYPWQMVVENSFDLETGRVESRNRVFLGQKKTYLEINKDAKNPVRPKKKVKDSDTIPQGLWQILPADGVIGQDEAL